MPPTTTAKPSPNGSAPTTTKGGPAARFAVAQTLHEHLSKMDPATRQRARERVASVLLDSEAGAFAGLVAALHAHGQLTADVWAAADQFVGTDLGYGPLPGKGETPA